MMCLRLYISQQKLNCLFNCEIAFFHFSNLLACLFFSCNLKIYYFYNNYRRGIEDVQLGYPLLGTELELRDVDSDGTGQLWIGMLTIARTNTHTYTHRSVLVLS